MKKGYRNKQSQAESNKKPAITLVCLKECVAPGFGHWKPGDEITDPALVERFSRNPHYFAIKEA